jgi:hypothetical protein
MNFNRYSPRRNPTFYESLAERTIDNIRNGGQPHGGNFEVLVYYAPQLAIEVLDRILDEKRVPEEEWPTTIEGIADLFEWELTGQRTDFIRRHSPSPESGTETTDTITELAMAAKVLKAEQALGETTD